MCKSNGFRWSNTVGFIPHGCKQCSDAGGEFENAWEASFPQGTDALKR
jgi:hypothetical protein